MVRNDYKNVLMYSRGFINSLKVLVEEYKIERYSISELDYKIKKLIKAESLVEIKRNDFLKKNLEELQISRYNIKFNKKIKSLFIEEISRKDSGQFLNQLLTVIQLINTELNNRNKDYNLLTTNEIRQIILKINPDEYFVMIMETIYNKYKKNYGEKDSEISNLDIKVLGKPYIESTDLYYSLKDKIFKHVLILLSDYYKKRNVFSHVEEYFSINSIHVKKIIHSVYLSNFTKQLEKVFETEVCEESFTSIIENKKHKRVIHIIPSCFLNRIFPKNHLPEIIEPLEFKTNDLLQDINFIKHIKNGASEIIFSDQCKEALTLSQKKKFKINKNMIKLLKRLDGLEYSIAKNLELDSFVPLSILDYNYDYLIKNKHDFIPKNQYKKHIMPYYNKNKEKFYEQLRKNSYISVEAYLKHCLYQERLDKFKSMYEQRRISNSFVIMAEILQDIPLYYLNSIDYRLRMYPYNFLFSRTTGVFKHFLMDFNPIQLSADGLNNLLTSYYQFNIGLLTLYKKYTRTNFSISDLIKFYKSNPIINNTKKFIYFSLIKTEIDYLEKNNFYSGFLVEIDQKSSSSVFLSYLFKLKSLALQCNLLESKNNDVPLYLGKKTADYFNQKGWFSSDHNIILKKFEDNRKLHKYSLMCFCYNQTSFGRWKRWFEDTEGHLTENQKKCLIEFSNSYEEFLNMCFPGIINKRNAINNIYLEIIKVINSTHIKSLDNCIFKWRIFKKNPNNTNKARNVYDNEKHISFRNGIITNFDKLHNSKMVNTFLPGLIHSIDGSIMRIFILKMYQKTFQKCILQHIHDAVLLHPNYVDLFYLTVSEVYSNKDLLDDLLKKTILDITLPLLPEESFKKIMNIYIDNFKSNSDLNFNDIVIDPSHLYCYEN